MPAMKEKKHSGKTPAEIAENLGIDNVETHLFLCAGPDCCDPQTGAESWRGLKKKLKQVYPRLREAAIYRTKVSCLRICEGGPIAVAYPQGRWFRGVTPDRVEEIVDYLRSGTVEPHPLEFKRHPLAAAQ